MFFYFYFIQLISILRYRGHTLHHCMFPVLRAVGTTAADIWRDSIKPLPVWWRSRSDIDPDCPCQGCVCVCACVRREGGCVCVGGSLFKMDTLLRAEPPAPCFNLLSSDLRQVEPPLTDILSLNWNILFCSQTLRHWNVLQLLATTSWVTCFHNTYKHKANMEQQRTSS